MELLDCLVVRGVSPLMGTAEVDDSELYASAVAREGELAVVGGVPALVVAEEAALVLISWILVREKAGLVGGRKVSRIGLVL